MESLTLQPIARVDGTINLPGYPYNSFLAILNHFIRISIHLNAKYSQ